jgi:peptidoglycan/LPS O-acetylase OafA/YrhL
LSTRTRTAEGPASGAAPRGEIKALTGLRAVAATWVVLYHLTWLSSAYLDGLSFLRPLFQAGWTGVELFFVLSGFVIARSYLDDMGTRWRFGGTFRFLFNRVARVWPAYALMTVFAFAWLVVIGHLGWAVDVVAPHPERSLAELGAQLTMTQSWGWPGVSGLAFNAPGWSIASEFFAYLTFPVLALLVRPLRRLHPVLLLALACAAMWPLFDISYGGVPTIGLNWMVRITCCFVAGMLACLSARGMQRRERAEQWGLILSVTSLVCILLLSCWAAWRATLSTGDFAGVVTVTYPALIVGLALSDRGPARVLSTAPLVYGGRISYCLYLVHFMVMDVVVTCYWQDEARRGQVTPALALAVPLIALASFALAAALHHGVEEAARLRMLAWLRRRTGARETAPVATPVPAAAAASAPRPVVLPLPTAEIPARERAAAAARDPWTARSPAAGPAARPLPPVPQPAVPAARGAHPPGLGRQTVGRHS